MIAVLDASAAAEVVLCRKKSASFNEKLASADIVISPAIYVAEITNVFWKYFRFGDLSREDCHSLLKASLELPDDFIGLNELTSEAFAMACDTGLTVYDAYYLVLARRHNALLLSLDTKLSRTSKKLGIRIL